MFLPARKLKKKEEIEENYITTFDTYLSAFANLKKKLILKTAFQNLNSKLSIFLFVRDVYDYMIKKKGGGGGGGGHNFFTVQSIM